MLNSGQVKWRQVVQSIINQVVHNFYQLPPNAQNQLNIMKLIDRYWKHVSPKAFESKIHYYMVLAKTTDHLLQYLSGEKKQKPPLFLYQKLNTYIEELETQLSLTFDLAEWTPDSFTVRKWLVEADEELIQLYNHLIVVFSHEAFGKVPEKIEIITLLDGQKYTFSPTMNKVTQGMMYLEYMKSLLQRPNDYSKTSSKTECETCSFANKCKNSINNFKRTNNLNENYLH
jgi:hypothetical protein